MKKPKDIKKLDEQISRFKKQILSDNQKKTDEDTDFSRTAVGWQISVELLAAVIIGAGIGYVLDNLLNVQPWLLVIFTIFGGAAGMLNIYRTFRDESEKK